jgi:prepilin-type N-terminal cleavage/methylation domain-containing protein
MSHPTQAPKTRCEQASAGFTLLELMITVSLVSLVMVNVWLVLSESSKAYSARTVDYDAEVQAQRTLDRISEALIGASTESLETSVEAPNFADRLRFEINVGFENGEPVFGEPQEIRLEEPGQEVVWVESPEEVDQRRVVWSRWVREFLEGEVPNGIDDNANGVIDEKGLSFDLEGDMVTTRLTIERPGSDGSLITKTLTSRVTCRN